MGIVSPDYVKFLRDLQNLRSSGTAHRKGSNYRKIAEELGIDNQSLRVVFDGILVKGIQLLRQLKDLVESGALHYTATNSQVQQGGGTQSAR